MKATKIAASLEQLLTELSHSTMKFSQGDKFDEFVQRNIIGPLTVKAEAWKNEECYREARLAIKADNNNGVVQLNTAIDAFVLIDKPNGAQCWPDTLLLEGQVGVCLEYKSSKEGKVVWNSGLPRPSGIYLIHAYGKSNKLTHRTSFFLGEDAISDIETRLMIDGRKNLEVANKTLLGELEKLKSKWSLYVRPMHNWNVNPVTDSSRVQRENRVFEFLKLLK